MVYSALLFKLIIRVIQIIILGGGGGGRGQTRFTKLRKKKGLPVRY
jgi:hypothetical protein